MNSIGIVAGLLSVIYQNSLSIVTILQDKKGHLISLIIDDGIDVREYNYGKHDYDVDGYEMTIKGNYA